MKSNSHAILAYGVILSRVDDNWSDFLTNKAGILCPKKEQNSEGILLWKEYYKKRDNYIRGLGIGIELFGTPQQYYYLLAIKDSIFFASREFEEEINTEYLKIQPTWLALLRTASELLEISYQTPRWLLVNYSG